MIKCKECGHENPPNSNWCEECGAQIAPAPTPPPPPPEQRPDVTPPPPETPAPSARIAYVLTFKNGSFDVSDQIRVFGREDFLNYLSDSEYQYISKRHFTISTENGRFFIQDGCEEGGSWKNSTNGTKLNGEPIRSAERKELKDNDKIQVADTVELQFNIKQ